MRVQARATLLPPCMVCGSVGWKRMSAQGCNRCHGKAPERRQPTPKPNWVSFKVPLPTWQLMNGPELYADEPMVIRQVRAGSGFAVAITCDPEAAREIRTELALLYANRADYREDKDQYRAASYALPTAKAIPVQGSKLDWVTVED